MKALSSNLSLKGAFFYEFQETKMKKIKKNMVKNREIMYDGGTK